VTDDARFRFWLRWLYFAFVGSTIIGVALVSASGTALFGWWNGPIARNFWGRPAFPADADAYRGWITAVLGATLAAWSVLGALVTRSAFARRERWARDAIVASLVVWFPLDTIASMAAGVWVNVWFNVVALAALTPPLFATRTAFRAE
jgi:hypothetical protein